MNRFFYPLALALALATTGSAQTSEQQFSYAIGGVVGKVTRPSDGNILEREISYGGMVNSIQFKRPINRTLTFGANANLLIDPGIGQVTQQGLGTELNVNLFGGSAKRSVHSSLVKVDYYRGHALDFTLGVGLDFYGISSETDTSQSVSGSILQSRVGAEYRIGNASEVSFSIKYLRHVYGLPASTDRLSASGAQTLFCATTFL